MPKQGAQLLKVWDNWSAGIGYLRDDGETPGMYTASAVLGDVGELRPAPFKNDCDASTKLGASIRMSHFFEAHVTPGVTGTPGVAYLYGIGGSVGAGDREVLKIDMRNATFAAAVEVGVDAGAGGLMLGQPAYYQGKWYVGVHPDDGVDPGLQELTTINTPAAADSWTGAVAGTGCDNVINIGHQLAGSGTNYGIRLLKVDGTPTTAAHWGPWFPVGDKNQRVLALASIGGAVFVLNQTGLYSFNVSGRAGTVIGEFHNWRILARPAQMSTFKGGLVFPHPSGLMYYRPGYPPIGIGPDTKPGAKNPPPGPTELQGGIYQGVTVLGDVVYCFYQPDRSSTAALLLSGHGDDPANLSWQAIAALTMVDASTDSFHGVGVAPSGYPVSANYPTPTVWVSDSSTAVKHLSYIILNSRGSPFRPRRDTHKTTAAGSAYMSEIYLPRSTNLSHIVVHTQDMVTGDEWQLTGIADADGTERNYGAPIISNGRSERKVDKTDVSRFMLKVGWSTTVTTARAAPAVKRIELWGSLE